LTEPELKKRWPGAEPLLSDALSRAIQEYKSAIGGNLVPASFDLGQSQSGSHQEPEKAVTNVADVVTQPGESCEKVIITAGIPRI